ncbi:biliverdin-producing heme oxygenase [Polaromonas sp.]|uniref:biliverdin-producing heme oxygenase n=1 Tax=Polaromonas sp. TaxID=1869339 RepID=UPI00356A1660
MAVLVVTDPESQHEAAFPPVAPSSILSRLRLETRGEHDAVEQVLDLMGGSLTHQSYRQRLEQFYGFYAPLEKALQSHGKSPPDIADRPHGAYKPPLSEAISSALAARLNKTAHLQQDLHHFGVLTDGLLLCRDLPPLGTQAEVLGCLYVMEGATLGGRMITQHVRATLGITPMTGGCFFEGYGDDTGRMWQGMRQLLVSGSTDTQAENSIVTNAITTFARLRGWCETFPKTARQRDHAPCLKT